MLKVKGQKFDVSTVSFLGYVIIAKGVAMDKMKVKAVKQWPVSHIV